ncbi:hypothetical protein [Sphingobacterium cavernae]|uniref:hypothetical protein n=1 Tax=Sphingobacterium cavernae TaxID=2592657 RepID=UPI00122FC0E8|nr:hypothetical protein [Sphingobacterium cavernae]
MLKASKRIVIISEKVNKYGFRALVKGVDITQYERNPIMLWLHNRAFGTKQNAFLPLGNVIDLKIEDLPEIGICLTGLPVFDDTDEFAVSIYNKYENGTLRMASAGLIPVEWSDDDKLIVQGQRGATLIRSILEEISIVDIGADNNALSIALYDVNHNRIELSSQGSNAIIPLLKSNTEIEMEKIELTAAQAAVLLGVPEIKTAEAFQTKVAEIVQLAHTQKTQIETLTREKSELETELDEQKTIQLTAKIETLVQGAVDARKITADEKAEYITLAQANYESVEKLLNGKQGAPTIQSQINANASANVNLYANKTWSDLDKENLLIRLKSENLNLFKELYKAEFGTEYNG